MPLNLWLCRSTRIYNNTQFYDGVPLNDVFDCEAGWVVLDEGLGEVFMLSLFFLASFSLGEEACLLE